MPEGEAFATALEHYRAGRVAAAVAGCDALLAADPQHAEALQLLGVAADAGGDPARGAALIGQALALRETAGFRCNHGMVLGHLGHHAQALDEYDRALELRPDYPEALNNRGVSLDALGARSRPRGLTGARSACVRASPPPGPTWATRCAGSAAPKQRSRPANRRWRCGRRIRRR